MPSKGSRLLRTDIALDISPYAGVLSHRSGANSKEGIWIYGLIDPDYRGEIKVNIMNTSDKPYEIKKGDRIAQLRLVKVPKVKLVIVEDLDDTERGQCGFGSTGK